MLKSFFAVCISGTLLFSGAISALAQSAKIIYRYDDGAEFKTKGDAFDVYQSREIDRQATLSGEYSTFKFAEVTNVSPDYVYESEQPQRLVPTHSYETPQMGFKSSLGEQPLDTATTYAGSAETHFEQTFVVQAGAFASFTNAQRLSAKLSRYGSTNIMDGYLNGQRIYRVYLGSWGEKSHAQPMLDLIKARGFEGFITTQ